MKKKYNQVQCTYMLDYITSTITVERIFFVCFGMCWENIPNVAVIVLIKNLNPGA